jgi:hypothetical protein
MNHRRGNTGLVFNFEDYQTPENDVTDSRNVALVLAVVVTTLLVELMP